VAGERIEVVGRPSWPTFFGERRNMATRRRTRKENEDDEQEQE